MVCSLIAICSDCARMLRGAGHQHINKTRASEPQLQANCSTKRARGRTTRWLQGTGSTDRGYLQEDGGVHLRRAYLALPGQCPHAQRQTPLSETETPRPIWRGGACAGWLEVSAVQGSGPQMPGLSQQTKDSACSGEVSGCFEALCHGPAAQLVM